MGIVESVLALLVQGVLWWMGKVKKDDAAKEKFLLWVAKQNKLVLSAPSIKGQWEELQARIEAEENAPDQP